MKAFRSFAEEAFIKFPETGLVLIRGNDNKSGESSGTGKSNVNLAIAYALDFPGQLPATELQSWLTDEPLQVYLCLGTPQGDVVIGRGKKNVLKIGDQTITGARAISENFQKVFGQIPEVLAALTYRAQARGGLFLSKTDSEKKEFLSQLVGLDRFEASVDAAEEEIKNLTRQLPQLEAALQSEKQALERKKNNTGQLIFEDDSGVVTVLEDAQRRLEEAKNQHEEAKQAVKVLSSQNISEGGFNKKMDDLSAVILGLEKDAREVRAQVMPKSELVALRESIIKRIKDLQADDTARKKKEDAAIQDMRQKLTGALSIAASLPHLEKELHSIEAKIKAVKEDLCPTCGQEWPQDVAMDISKYMEEMAQLKTKIHNIQNVVIPFTITVQRAIAVAQNAFQPHEDIKKLEDLKIRFDDDISAEAARFEREKLQALDALNTKTTALRADFENVRREKYKKEMEAEALVSSRLAKVLELGNFIAHARNKIEAIKGGNEWKQREYDRNTQEVLTQEELVIVAQGKLTTLQKSLAQEKDYVEMVGRNGFLGLVFDEILQEISEEANTRLGRLPNVSHVTIRFRTESLLQKGTLKKSIVPLVNVGGHEGRLEAALSGGMKASVHQIVDLALMDVIQRRTGCMPGWFSMDESGEGQGLVTKESALEVLRSYAQEKLILVIDHMTEVKESFSQFIDIEFDKSTGHSRVVSCPKD